MVLGIIFTAVGILATIIVAAIFYIKSLREIRPTYYFVTELLLDVPEQVRDRISLKIRGIGDHKKLVFSSRIMFWNAGKRSIRKSDLADGHPMTIELLDGQILSAELENFSRTANGCTLSMQQDRKSLTLNYDYLNKRDFAEIYILHDSVNPPLIKGEFIGANLAHCKTPPKPIFLSPRWIFAGFILGHAWMFAWTAESALLEAGFPFEQHRKVAPFTFYAITIAGGGAFAVWCAITLNLWSRKFRFPKSDALYNQADENSLATARLKQTADQLAKLAELVSKRYEIDTDDEIKT